MELTNHQAPEATMIGTVANYAAELEQALTVELEDRKNLGEGMSFAESERHLFEQFSPGGADLIYDHQNDLYPIVHSRHPEPAPYVLFH